MKLKYLFINIAFFAGVISCVAQTTTPVLSLDSCISMALKNNRKVQISKNEEESSLYMKREALTKYFPEIFASGFAVWANHDMVQYNVLNLIELGLIKNGKAAGVQAVQPIFMGGRIVNGNKLAGIGEEVAKLRSQQTENDLRLTVENMYWKLVTLKAQKTTLEEAITTLDSISDQVKVAVDAGVALNNDYLKVTLKRNAYRSEMVDLENGIQLVKMLLGQYVGLGTSGNLDVDSEVPSEMPSSPESMFLSSRDALAETTSYKLLQKNIDAKKLERRMTLGDNLPTVALGAGWYYHDFFDQNHNFGAIQLVVNVPLSGWWGGSYALKQKDVALTNAKLEMEEYSEQLQIEMKSKWDDLMAAHRKMGIEIEGISQSNENLRLNKMYYEAGMSTIADLLEAETELKQARERYVTAYGAYRTAQAAYLISTGR